MFVDRALSIPLLIVLVLTSRGQASPYTGAIVTKGVVRLTPFDYRGVTLGDSRWQWQMAETRDAYLRVPNDDLLKGFRARAGKPAPGADLGGWYSDDFFHCFGQIVSGLSRMYAATGGRACRDKVNALISGWAECIAPDGYFYASSRPNATHYVYDKMVCGLLDACLYCGNKDALKHLSRITDWAIKHLTTPQDEWYTLSENLYRAYLVTGDRKYLDFGRRWEHTEYWNHYARNESIFPEKGIARMWVGYHAYSHVNTLSGAAMGYLITGEKHYLDTIVNAYDYLRRTQVYATGGYGPNESLLHPDRLPSQLVGTASFETQCGSWAGFKLTKYLMSFTGDARYGDWTERLLINGIGAGLPLSPKGEAFYYANYCINGASKEYTPGQWPCCAGTMPQAVADYHDIIYFRGSDGVCVNLFVPSSVIWEGKAGKVTLTQETRFPESDRVSIRVDTDRPMEFTIRVRVPGWLAKPMSARVNGEAVECKADGLHWAEFRRAWRNGDRLEITLPMGFYLQRFPACSSDPYPAAMTVGPVVLAFRSSSNPSEKLGLDNPGSDLIPSPGEPLTYHLASDPSALARPFYAFKQGEKYFMYLAPGPAMKRITDPAIGVGYGWSGSERMGISATKGAHLEYAFEGVGIRWLGCKYDDAAKTEVRIDGEVVGIVDQYCPVRDTPFEWRSKPLKPGKHVIRLTNTGEKDPDSKGIYINLTDLIPIPE